jgi:hypothetical protein
MNAHVTPTEPIRNAGHGARALVGIETTLEARLAGG